jgi:hypothetical protein
LEIELISAILPWVTVKLMTETGVWPMVTMTPAGQVVFATHNAVICTRSPALPTRFPALRIGVIRVIEDH